MLKPKFLLTKKIPLTVYRIGLGSWVDGKWVEGSETEVEIEVNIQPFKNHELMMLPESERSRKWYKLYSADEIRTLNEGENGSDEFIFEGERYRVMSTRRFSMGTLDHWKATAARIPLTPN